MALINNDILIEGTLISTNGGDIYRKFVYSTSDTLAVVTANDYFAGAGRLINVGDIIQVYTTESGAVINRESKIRVSTVVGDSEGVYTVTVSVLA